MIDTINPMGFDITKNLHGHVRVETRDRWTGRVVDSQEKENLVTNAVQELVMAQAWMRSSASGNPMSIDMLPLHSKALGGLLLFDGTLTASASNTAFPSSVKLIGCAGQTSDNANAIKGSLNTQESVYTSTGFSTVWDFATSQANGTIASLARTSYNFVASALTQCEGAFNYSSDSSTIPSSTSYLGYDDTNNYLYLGLTSATTIGNVTYPTSNIYRVKANFSNVGLITSYLLPASKWTLVKTLTSSDGSANATDFTYDKYDNNFVYATGTTIHIVAMDGTHTTKTATGTDGVIYVSENYYWRFTQNNTYCIQKSNTANVQSFNVGKYQGMLLTTDGDAAIPCGGPYNLAASFNILYPDGTVIDIPEASTYWGSSGHAVGVGQLYAKTMALRNPSFYLGTIANLDSPVTKTSSQTMKITYTLTEA